MGAYFGRLAFTVNIVLGRQVVRVLEYRGIDAVTHTANPAATVVSADTGTLRGTATFAGRVTGLWRLTGPTVATTAIVPAGFPRALRRAAQAGCRTAFIGRAGAVLRAARTVFVTVFVTTAISAKGYIQALSARASFACIALTTAAVASVGPTFVAAT